MNNDTMNDEEPHLMYLAVLIYSKIRYPLIHFAKPIIFLVCLSAENPDSSGNDRMTTAKLKETAKFKVKALYFIVKMSCRRNDCQRLSKYKPGNNSFWHKRKPDRTTDSTQRWLGR